MRNFLTIILIPIALNIAYGQTYQEAHHERDINATDVGVPRSGGQNLEYWHASTITAPYTNTTFVVNSNGSDKGACIFRADNTVELEDGFQVLNYDNTTQDNTGDCVYFHAYTEDRFSDNHFSSSSSDAFDDNFEGITSLPAKWIPASNLDKTQSSCNECDVCAESTLYARSCDEVILPQTSTDLLNLHSTKLSQPITACPDANAVNKTYTTSEISTKTCGKASTTKEILYGRLTYKVIPPSGQGIQFAHWLFGAFHSGYQEIDVTEWRTNEFYAAGQGELTPKTILQAEYWNDIKNANIINHAGVYQNPTGDYSVNDHTLDANGDHTFALEWIPGEMRYLYDGVEVRRTTRGVPSLSMFILLSNYVGQYDDPNSNVCCPRPALNPSQASFDHYVKEVKYETYQP